MAKKEWNTTYNQDDNGQLKKLQHTLLGNIKVFTKICEDNDLRYFMVGGTMLGAIRHKGFIPWDDDVDFGMPRKDYEEFLKIASKGMPEGYAFLNYKHNKNYHRYFSRIVDLRVKIYNDSNSREIIENAWIDIFPFDGLPKGKLHQRIHFYHCIFWRFLFHASCFDEMVNLNRPGRLWYQQLAIKFLKFTKFGTHLNSDKLLNRIDKLLRNYSYDDSSTVMNFFGAYMTKEILPKYLLGNLRKYDFEDCQLYGPEHFDKYLRRFYGNYKMVPKEADKDKHDIRRIEYIE